MIQNQSKTESGNWFPWNRYGSNIRKNKREPGHGEAGAYGAGKSGITGMVGTGSASNPGLSHEGHEKHSGSNVGAHQGTKGWSQSHAPSKLRGTWDKMTGSVEVSAFVRIKKVSFVLRKGLAECLDPPLWPCKVKTRK